ncbi:type II toxin-antitoxin system MqsA family antitoxin [Dyella sp.]|jgi:HTH-type transcriptional regulator/antitoxin MqsA|uniref:type II toxin-antitoxin system MqsA family antitoxin n=1 Tax=Dyella sp. TaxID=1869338 RepID=UPI002B907611|nr:type II toxin-antitoxin system MqsA family antitoxin [Dyella sp.]HTC27252.1 type II toxin-antitoxin system MqsA family antitoxin [Dyella sp.]
MTDSKLICPICEEGALSELVYSDVLQFRGVDREVHGLVMSVCSHCEEQSMTAAQLKANARLMAAARSVVIDEERANHGLLVSKEVRRVREKLGLTQQQAATVFGGGANAFSKYERGEVVQSEIMDKLLRLCAEVPTAACWLFDQVGLEKQVAPKAVEATAVRKGVFLDYMGMPDIVGIVGAAWGNDSHLHQKVWSSSEKIVVSHSGEKSRRNPVVRPTGIAEPRESRDWENVPMARCA